MNDTPTVQTEKGRRVIESVPVLHPFLLALYPVLGLYAYNQERTLFSAVLRPGLMLVAAAFVLWLALGAVMRNSYKAGVVTSLIVVAATSGWNVLEYGMATVMTGISGHSAILYYLAFGLAAAGGTAALVWYSKSSAWHSIRLAALIVLAAAALLYLGDLILAPIFERGPAWAMLAYAVCVGLALLAISGWPGELRRATSTLNIFGVILLVLSGANILINRPAATAVEHPAPPAPPAPAEVAPSGPRPDVWFIAVDGYARADVMASLYGYNPQPFAASLNERAFTHVPRSTANYGVPIEALASCLNMQYLHEINGGGRDAMPLHTMAAWYHENSVSAYLRGAGYDTYASAPPQELLKPRGDDKRVLDSRLLPTEFEVVLLEGTVASRLLQATHYIRHRSLAELRHIVSRARIEAKLQSMRELAATPPDGAPRFIQAYLSVPNVPFLFDRDGGWPESVGLYSYGGRALFRGGMAEYQEGYTEQVYWFNAEMLALIDIILEHAETPPIILLVSLHGPTGPPGGTPEQQDLMLTQRFLNFTALHLPGEPEVPRDLSPVNLFRFVFNEYMGLEYPLLPNHRYISHGVAASQFERLP